MKKLSLKKTGFLLFALAVLTAPIFAQKTATYTNPVQAGDYPDPSMIRVGKDFYATATSSEWSPEFPILHSTDLVNWEIVGDVFPTRPEWSNGNYWAPEIWQENGKFYIFYVAHKIGGSLCIAAATADKPTGPYTDHGALVCQAAGSIDAFPIRDENGKLFVVWKEDGNSVNKPTPIWAQELDNNNWKLVGEPKEILRNDPESWEGNLVEGPFIMRKGDYFYLFYSGNACCGRGCNYAMGVARSKTLLGTWEKSPENPILKGNENFNCPGHGSAVTLEDGRTFMLYHAYDPKDTNYVGRQALLDEVNWTKDGWATINNGKGASKSAASPLKAVDRQEEYKFFDDFNSPNLRFGWQWQQNNVPVYQIKNGWLTLSPNVAQAKNIIGAIMARSTTVGDYAAMTQIDSSNLPKNALIGISAYGDNENALGVGLENGKITIWRRQQNKQETLSTIVAPKSKQLYLKMIANEGHFFSFFFSRDGKTWQRALNPDDKMYMDTNDKIDGAFLPPWDRGVRVALTVGGAENAAARFGFLRIEPNK